MKMQNKKRGFTIVELVIVIAVIGILAGVLVPTFTGIVKKAKVSAAQQEATSIYHAVLGTTEFGEINNAEDTDVDAYIVVNSDYYVTLTNGKLSDPIEAKTTPITVDFEETLPTTAGEYYVPVKLLPDDFKLNGEEYPVYVYHVVE